jgi:2,3-bisphosphoglycerate-independent phosphoglycerate mutase
MGNSEVGHLNLGAGRIVYQELTRIDKAIEDGDFFENNAFLNAFKNAKENDKRVHIMGLLSDGGVHSHINHLKALFKLAEKENFENLTVHCFMDGRDTPPDSGKKYIKLLSEFIDKKGFGEIGVISGRFYAMDRDKRWDRIEKAYNALVSGEGEKAGSPEEAVLKSYKSKITDEFIKPVIVEGSSTVRDGDSIIFYNFRADRARELTHAFVDKDFTEFDRKKVELASFVTFTHYENGLPVNVAFPPESLTNILGEILANNSINQLRIAETEKYAHVTFFFNGGREEKFENEDRILVPSPKVATYDLKPEMSAYEVKDKVLDAIESDKYQVIILNFANCDMVGHTGFLNAAIKAVETVDKCVSEIVDTVLKKEWHMILTADHGNADKMFDENKEPFTAHSTNPVPVCLISKKYKNRRLKKGALKDIAPTILDILGITKPKEMTGISLIE